MNKDIKDEEIDFIDSSVESTPEFEDVDLEFPENEDITPLEAVEMDETAKLYNKVVTIVSTVLVGIAIIAVIIAAAVKSGNGRRDSDGGEVTLIDNTTTIAVETTEYAEETTVNAPTTQAESQTDATNATSADGIVRLDSADYPEITALVENYYAALMSADYSRLNGIIYYDNGESLNQMDVELQSEIIEGYNINRCYIYKGDENTFIVYVSYSIKFVNVSTNAPALTRFCIVNTDGKYELYNGTLSDTVQQNMSAVENSKEIQSLSSSINCDLADARAKDGKLNALLSILNVTNETQTTAAETSETQAVSE